jgi:hypothetical protein
MDSWIVRFQIVFPGKGTSAVIHPGSTRGLFLVFAIAAAAATTAAPTMIIAIGKVDGLQWDGSI